MVERLCWSVNLVNIISGTTNEEKNLLKFSDDAFKGDGDELQAIRQGSQLTSFHCASI